MSISGLENQLNSYKSNGGKNNYCKKAFDMTYSEVKKSLQEYKEKGFEYIPAEGCTNIGKNGACECGNV